MRNVHLLSNALGLYGNHAHTCSYESSVSYRVVVGVSESVTTESMMAQSSLEFCPIHCPNGRLGQDLGFGGIAFALKLPELLGKDLVSLMGPEFGAQ